MFLQSSNLSSYLRKWDKWPGNLMLSYNCKDHDRSRVISFLVFIEHLWSMIFPWLPPKHVIYLYLTKTKEATVTSNELLKKANITNLYSCFTNYCPNLTKTMNRLTCLIKVHDRLVFQKSTLCPARNISCNKWQNFPLCTQFFM